MKCYLKLLTYVVNLLLIGISFGVSYEEIESRVKEKVRNEFGSSVKIENLKVFLPKDAKSWHLRNIEIRLKEKLPKGTVAIILETPKGIKKISGTLSLLWACDVPVLVDTVRKGERIYPWQVSFERKYLKTCPRTGVPEGNEVLNYVALRDLKKGEILKLSYLRRVPLVKRGERVSVIFRSGSIEISFYGEALQNGYIGDRIRVKSLNSGKILIGEVVSEGTVLVK